MKQSDYDKLLERAENATGEEAAAWQAAIVRLREADAALEESRKVLALGDALRARIAQHVDGLQRLERATHALQKELENHA